MRGANTTMRGRFKPQNPQKYVGNVNNVLFRSSWELQFMKWLDQNPAIMRWGSEELAIQYISPLDGKIHRYYPDMIIMYRHRDGTIRKEIVEIKPYSQTVPTPKMSDRDKQALVVNDAKWKAATIWAEGQGAKFRVITEKTMFAGIRKQQPPAMGRSV